MCDKKKSIQAQCTKVVLLDRRVVTTKVQLPKEIQKPKLHKKPIQSKIRESLNRKNNESEIRHQHTVNFIRKNKEEIAYTFKRLEPLICYILKRYKSEQKNIKETVEQQSLRETRPFLKKKLNNTPEEQSQMHEYIRECCSNTNSNLYSKQNEGQFAFKDGDNKIRSPRETYGFTRDATIIAQSCRNSRNSFYSPNKKIQNKEFQQNGGIQGDYNIQSLNNSQIQSKPNSGSASVMMRSLSFALPKLKKDFQKLKQQKLMEDIMKCQDKTVYSKIASVIQMLDSKIKVLGAMTTLCQEAPPQELIELFDLKKKIKKKLKVNIDQGEIGDSIEAFIEKQKSQIQRRSDENNSSQIDEVMANTLLNASQQSTQTKMFRSNSHLSIRSRTDRQRVSFTLVQSNHMQSNNNSVINSYHTNGSQTQQEQSESATQPTTVGPHIKIDDQNGETIVQETCQLQNKSSFSQDEPLNDQQYKMKLEKRKKKKGKRTNHLKNIQDIIKSPQLQARARFQSRQSQLTENGSPTEQKIQKEPRKKTRRRGLSKITQITNIEQDQITNNDIGSRDLQNSQLYSDNDSVNELPQAIQNGKKNGIALSKTISFKEELVQPLLVLESNLQVNTRHNFIQNRDKVVEECRRIQTYLKQVKSHDTFDGFLKKAECQTLGTSRRLPAEDIQSKKNLEQYMKPQKNTNLDQPLTYQDFRLMIKRLTREYLRQKTQKSDSHLTDFTDMFKFCFIRVEKNENTGVQLFRRNRKTSRIETVHFPIVTNDNRLENQMILDHNQLFERKLIEFSMVFERVNEFNTIEQKGLESRAVTSRRNPTMLLSPRRK